MQVRAAVGLALAIYNVDVSAWEPFLEPVLDEASSRCELWSIDAHLTIQPSKASDASTREDALALALEETRTATPPAILCAISSSDPLNLTVTSNGLDALLQSAFVAGDTSGGHKTSTVVLGDQMAVERSFAAFELQNSSGHMVHVVLGDSFDAGNTFEVRNCAVRGPAVAWLLPPILHLAAPRCNTHCLVARGSPIWRRRTCIRRHPSPFRSSSWSRKEC